MHIHAYSIIIYHWIIFHSIIYQLSNIHSNLHHHHHHHHHHLHLSYYNHSSSINIFRNMTFLQDQILSTNLPGEKVSLPLIGRQSNGSSGHIRPWITLFKANLAWIMWIWKAQNRPKKKVFMTCSCLIDVCCFLCVCFSLMVVTSYEDSIFDCVGFRELRSKYRNSSPLAKI